jgi:hypothetical protein
MEIVFGKLVENANGDLVQSIHCDNYGNIVRRPKHEYPYSYDPYVLWQHDDESVLDQINGSMYTDRLLQWDFDKHDKLCEKHFGDKGQYWNNRDPKKIEAFVRDWCEDQGLTFARLTEYCNHGNGFPVWLLSYVSR